MVRINNLALIALSASALAATTHNDHRRVEVLTEAEVLSRAAPLMDLDRRQIKVPDSLEVQKLKDERKAISPELDQAKQEMRAAQKAAEDAIPQELKRKEKEAKKNMRAALKASNDAIPQELKRKEKDAFKKFKNTRQGLSEDKKNQLRENGKALEAARSKEPPSPPGPVPNIAPSVG